MFGCNHSDTYWEAGAISRKSQKNWESQVFFGQQKGNI